MARRRPADAPSLSDAAPGLFDAARTERQGEKRRKPLADDDHRHGHRARLRARFMAGGAAALADYELMELVLFRALPRRDVKPIAKRLLERFGDFAGVVAAAPERLREIDGVGEEAVVDLKIIGAAAQAVTKARLGERPLLDSLSRVTDHCRATIGRAGVEEFRVLFLDRKCRLIAEEALGRGTVDQVAVYPREVVKRALELDASGVILIHNHPSGDATPSRADLELTQRVATAAAAMGVAVHDHVIIGAADAKSFRSAGLL